MSSTIARSSKDSEVLMATANRTKADQNEKTSFGELEDSAPNRTKRAPRIHINVGGRHFEIARPLLASHPTTRLGRLARLIDGDRPPRAEELLELCDDFRTPAPSAAAPYAVSFNLSSNGILPNNFVEGPIYYFERDSTALPMLLNYYRTGRLHISEDMCTMNFAEELEYWNIDQSHLEPCCAHKFSLLRQTIADELKNEEELLAIAEEDQELVLFGTSRWEHVKKWLFLLLERPDNSIFSKVVMAFSIVFILLSTAALILNTVPCLLDGPTCNASSSGAPATSGDGSTAQPPSQALARNRSITPRPGLGVHNTTANPEHDSDFEDNEHIVFAATEAICVVWFTLEFLLRFICSPRKLHFMISPMNLIDLAAIVPYYVTQFVNLSIQASTLSRLSDLRRILQILRVLRIFRVLKLARHSTGLQALGYTFSSSYRELGLLVLFLGIGVVSFSALIFFAEKTNYNKPNNSFTSIPAAFCDMYPSTTIGKVIGAACCICGVLVIGMPIPFIVNNFTDYYRQQMEREKLAKRKALERRAARKRQLSNGSQTDSPFRHHHKSHQHSNSSTPRATTPSTHEAAAKPTAIHIGGPFFTIQRTGPDSAQSAREHQNDSQQRGIVNDIEHKAGLLEKRSVQRSKKF